MLVIAIYYVFFKRYKFKFLRQYSRQCSLYIFRQRFWVCHVKTNVQTPGFTRGDGGVISHPFKSQTFDCLDTFRLNHASDIFVHNLIRFSVQVRELKLKPAKRLL